MTWLIHEWRLLVRSRLTVVALLILLLLASVAVGAGIAQVRSEQATIARLTAMHDAAAHGARDPTYNGDAGYVAYYTFFPTWQAPSAAGFLASGMRDISPYVLRVRALALQSQLHDSETLNPEVAVLGRFDVAFVLTYLAPLFVIALLHDLVSDERQSGRLRVLMSMPGSTAAIWRRRAGLRYLALFMCLAVPVAVGAVIQGMSWAALATVLGITAAYLGVWLGLSLLIGARPWRPATHAIALMGCWAVLTLVVPGVAQLASSRAAPVAQGIALTLAQREHINAAWDVPRDATMQAFFKTHPQWADTAPLPERFHWKWYLAFHQLGDEAVSEAADAYREGLLTRQRWAERLAWVLPGVGVQVALQALAGVDLPAQLAYQDRVASFHADLRGFYYPYVFNDVKFGKEDLARMPRFADRAEAHGDDGAESVQGIARLVLAALLALVLGGWAVRRVSVS